MKTGRAFLYAMMAGNARSFFDCNCVIFEDFSQWGRKNSLKTEGRVKSGLYK